MDQELLKLLTKLKIKGKKLMGVDIDIVRLSSDRNYAGEILHKLTGSDDEDLVMSAIYFMSKMGLVKGPGEATAAAAAGEGDTAGAIEGKYTGRLR